MWPRGNAHAQLAAIDDRLAALSVGLREARNTEPEIVDELLARLDELLEQRDRIAALLPQPRKPIE